MDETKQARARVELIQNLAPRKITAGDTKSKKEAEDIVRSFKPIKNRDDGRVAVIPVNTVGKLIGHKGYDFSKIIAELPSLYETSILGWSEPEIQKEGHKSHTNIKEYHHYVNKFTDGNGEYFIRITAREEAVKPGKSERNIIHSTAISDVAIYKKEKDGHSVRLRVIDPGVASPPSFADLRLQQFFDSVKPFGESWGSRGYGLRIRGYGV